MINSTQTSQQLEAIILKYYDLGELADYEQLDLGYVNESYIVEIEHNDKKEKYFFRKYKQGIKEEEVIFEHSVIKHLIKKNFQFVARVVPAKDRKTYIKQSERGANVFYAIFDFLTGDDRYTWVNPTCSDGELRAAAALLAQFHDTVYDLEPKGKRYEAKIIDLLAEIAQTVEECAQKTGKTVFDTYFLENINLIQETIQRTQYAMEKDEYKELIELVIHCDYHPGNLKFQNGEITGLFDFDWAKVDLRSFDLALAITYLCVEWEGEQDGDLHLRKVAVFLDAYQNTLQNTLTLEPICDLELEFLPALVDASNIYILYWTIRNFYDTEVDPQEYLIYLQHGIRFMKWLENKDNWRQLKRIIISPPS